MFEVSAQKSLNINAIVMDDRLQARESIDEEAVNDYARAMSDGDKLPPLTVFFDGVSYFLADGFHRYLAIKRCEKTTAVVDVINGAFRDALLFSTQCNSKHGLRRTNADKRKAINKMLDDFEWSDWNNTQIAAHCVVSPHLVKELRLARKQEPEQVKFTTKSGKVGVRKATRSPKEPTEEFKEEPKEEPSEEPKEEIENIQAELIRDLQAENERLSDRIAVEAMDFSEEEKLLAQQTITELRERIRVLEIELEAVKRSRDTFQTENAQMKKQISMLEKKLK